MISYATNAFCEGGEGTTFNLEKLQKCGQKRAFSQLHTKDCKIGSSGRILMFFGPRSTNLRSRNTNLVRKMREIFCVHCKLVLKTGNFGCFCTFSPPYFCQFEWKSSCFLIRFVFLDLKLVDTGPNSIKIRPELPILQSFMCNCKKSPFLAAFSQLFNIKSGTLTSFTKCICGKGYPPKLDL